MRPITFLSLGRFRFALKLARMQANLEGRRAFSQAGVIRIMWLKSFACEHRNWTLWLANG